MTLPDHPKTAAIPAGLSARYHLVQRFQEGWSIFRENLIGRIGLALLGLFGLMALCSFIPPLIDPMYHPMTGVDPEISHSTGPGSLLW